MRLGASKEQAETDNPTSSRGRNADSGAYNSVRDFRLVGLRVKNEAVLNISCDIKCRLVVRIFLLFVHSGNV